MLKRYLTHFLSLQDPELLVRRHQTIKTDDKIITRIIKKATGSEIASSKRLVIGEFNEIYDIKTQNNQNIVLRIARKENPLHFRFEQWVLNKAHKAGILVPKVLLVEEVEFNGEMLSICVEEKIKGKALIELIESKEITKTQVLSVLEQAGEILSQIHNISSKNYGFVNEKGQGDFKSWEEFIFDLELDGIYEAASKTKVHKKTIDEVLFLLKSYSPYYQEVKSTVIHGDFEPKHILVENGQITGIIDFENYKLGDPVYDFAWWDFFQHKKYPIETLAKGYKNEQLFEDNFKEKLHLYGLQLSVCFLSYFYNSHNRWGIKVTKQNLNRHLKYFRSKKSPGILPIRILRKALMPLKPFRLPGQLDL
jgi:aminoglycoside phosphotransferase (APT) family kinase protein